MARISARQKQNGTLALTGVDQTSPNYTITRHWDAGPLLILGHMEIQFGGASITRFRGNIVLDGVGLYNAGVLMTQPLGGYGTCPLYMPVNIAAGVHTIALSGARDAGADALSWHFHGSSLVVIQLPQWDDETDVLRTV